MDPSLKTINLQKNGNNWTSGPAPPPPPGTPLATRRPRNCNSGGSPSNGGSSEDQKSGISGGALAGIIISVLVVGAVVAFFLVSRRSKRSSTDIEKLDNQPLQPLKMTAAQETKPEETSSTFYPTSFDTSATTNPKPPPIDRHKSFDEDNFSKRAAVKKASVAAPINVKSYSIADLQMATGSFNVENLSW